MDRAIKVVIALGFFTIGPVLIIYSTSPGLFGLFILGVALTVLGFSFGGFLLFFGELLPRAGKPLPKYMAQGVWRPQQSSEMIFGRAKSRKDDEVSD